MSIQALQNAMDFPYPLQPQFRYLGAGHTWRSDAIVPRLRPDDIAASKMRWSKDGLLREHTKAAKSSILLMKGSWKSGEPLQVQQHILAASHLKLHICTVYGKSCILLQGKAMEIYDKLYVLYCRQECACALAALQRSSNDQQGIASVTIPPPRVKYLLLGTGLNPSKRCLASSTCGRKVACRRAWSEAATDPLLTGSMYLEKSSWASTCRLHVL